MSRRRTQQPQRSPDRRAASLLLVSGLALCAVAGIRVFVAGAYDRALTGTLQERVLVVLGNPSSVAILGGLAVTLLLWLMVRRLVIAGEQVAAAAATARETLERERHRFEVLENDGWDGILVVDRTGLIRWMGATTARMLRLDDRDVAGASILGSVYESDINTFLGALSVAPNAPRRPFEFRMRDANGRVRRFDAVAVNHLEDPLLQGIVLHMRDATERHWAQNALRERDERFRAGFERSPFASALVDSDGHLTQVNAAFAALMGREVSDLLGRAIGSILTAKDRAAVRAAMHRMMRPNPSAYKRTVSLAEGHGAADLALVPVGDGPDSVRSYILTVVERPAAPEAPKQRKRVVALEEQVEEVVELSVAEEAVVEQQVEPAHASAEVAAPEEEGAQVLAMRVLAAMRASRLAAAAPQDDSGERVVRGGDAEASV